MNFFLCVIGTVMVVEGVPYFVSPEKMKEHLEKISITPTDQLRMLGLVSMLLGLFVVYMST